EGRVGTRCLDGDVARARVRELDARRRSPALALSHSRDTWRSRRVRLARTSRAHCRTRPAARRHRDPRRLWPLAAPGIPGCRPARSGDLRQRPSPSDQTRLTDVMNLQKPSPHRWVVWAVGVALGVAGTAVGQVKTTVPDVVPGAKPATVERITI